MRDLSRVANPARSGTVLASLPESSFVFVATRAGLPEGDNATGIRDVLKRRHGDVRPHFNGVPPVRRVPRRKIDGGERLTAEVRVGRVRGVSCELTPMVFENIEMRNPAGFLLEDARHGYIQYIRYLPSRFTDFLKVNRASHESALIRVNEIFLRNVKRSSERKIEDRLDTVIGRRLRERGYVRYGNDCDLERDIEPFIRV